MSKDIKVFDLVISCPSDVSEYIKILEEEVYDFNNHFGSFNDIIVRVKHWSTNVFPTLGKPAQKVINNELIDKADMLIGVFWTRFGTPTEGYGSGTEEEIERMIANEKQVFLYFLDKAICLSQIDLKQYDKVKLFKEKYKNAGIYFDVADEKELVRKFRGHLELYFNGKIKGPQFKKNRGKKEILWVDDRPENNIYERRMLEQYGLIFTLALSTQQALNCLEHNEFSLVISDMGRKEGAYEGYVLLDAIRKRNKEIPFIIYAGSRSQDHINETFNRGGQGCTNSPGELIDLVLKNLLNS